MKDILIVVDMQNDFIDGSLGTPEAQAIVDRVAEKISSFQGDIYYTRDTHHENYLETAEGKNLPVVHCVKDTEGWQIRKEIAEAAEGKSVTVIDKPTFGSEELAKRLAAEGDIRSITLVGLCTDICVISNALLLKAFFYETPVTVDASCCAGVTPESHSNALAAMKMCHIAVE